MPAIDIEWLTTHLKDENLISNYPIFVETGTYLGKTITNMEPHFKKLYTIEIKEDLYNRSKSRYLNYVKMFRYKKSKIDFLLGDSGEMIGKLCPNLKYNVVFFLDSHWSAGITGRGEKDCPLYEELTSIIEKFCKKCIIIIDDVRLFGKGPNNGESECDWEDINTKKIISILGDRLRDHHFAPSDLDEKDRLCLYLE